MNKQLHDEAADFFVEFQLGDDSPRTRRLFNAWLRKSPEHIRAYLQILPDWEEARHLRKAGIEELVEASRGINVEAFPNASVKRLSTSSPDVSARSGNGVFRNLALAAALTLLVVGSIAMYRIFERSAAPEYITKTGELLSLQLTDGSTIRLNAKSQIRAEFTDKVRTIELLQGQALFEVAKDPSRPFEVKTSDAHVRALGTAFDVERKAAGTTVTVVEGSVSVSEKISWFSSLPVGNRESIEQPVVLSAGQQVTATTHVITAPRHANAADTTAWTHHQLVFDDVPLGQVVEEFNRISDRSLLLDRKLENLSITAQFDSTDPGSLVRFLETLPGIEVRKTGADTEIRKSP